MKKSVLIFTGMYAEKYGAFERYNVALAKQLKANNVKGVFIYNNDVNTVKNYANDLKQCGAELVRLNPNQIITSLIKTIHNILKLYQPHVVHTHFNPKIVRLVQYLSFLHRVPKRYNTFHGIAQSKTLVTKTWMYSLSLCCTKQFAISEAIRQQQINFFKTPKNKIETLRLGLKKNLFEIKTSKEAIKKKYNLPDNGLLIGNVAFHNPIKGVDILVKAFSTLKHQIKENIYLCQVGSYNETYTAFLKQKAKDLGVDKYIIWLGIQNNVPELLNAFDIYVQPSRSEGLGLSILEAYYAKLPVVATNIDGIPEIVDNKKGLLFKLEDTNDLAKKLLDLVNSEALRRQKGNMGYSFINETYNLEKQIKLLLTYY